MSHGQGVIISENGSLLEELRVYVIYVSLYSQCESKVIPTAGYPSPAFIV